MIYRDKALGLKHGKNNNFGKQFFINPVTNFRCSHSLFSALKSKEHYKDCINSIFLTFRMVIGDGVMGDEGCLVRTSAFPLRSPDFGLPFFVFRLRFPY